MRLFALQSLAFGAVEAGRLFGRDPHLDAGRFYKRADLNNLFKRDTVVSTSYVDSGYNTFLGTANQLTTVTAGTYIWLNGGSTHNILGNLDNSGRITISQTAFLVGTPTAGGQSSYFEGTTAQDGVFINEVGSSLSANDFGSASAPSYYYRVYSFENRGTLQFCGRGDTGGSTYYINSELSAYNYGLIDYQQYNNNIGAAFFIENDVRTGTTSQFYNIGAIRILNVNLQIRQNFIGGGCFIVATGATLYLQDDSARYKLPAGSGVLQGQSIYFRDSTGTIHFDTLSVTTGVGSFGATIYGYKQGNVLEFFLAPQSFSYNTLTGLLNVVFTLNRNVNINIGIGYNSALFRQAAYTSKYGTYQAIFYDGPAPAQNVVSQCLLGGSGASDCVNPALTATAAFVSTTSTTAAPTTISTPTTVIPTTTPGVTTTPGATTPTANTQSTSAPTTSPGVTLPITCTCPAPASTVTVTATA